MKWIRDYNATQCSSNVYSAMSFRKLPLCYSGTCSFYNSCSFQCCQIQNSFLAWKSHLWSFNMIDDFRFHLQIEINTFTIINASPNIGACLIFRFRLSNRCHYKLYHVINYSSAFSNCFKRKAFHFEIIAARSNKSIQFITQHVHPTSVSISLIFSRFLSSDWFSFSQIFQL